MLVLDCDPTLLGRTARIPIAPGTPISNRGDVSVPWFMSEVGRHAAGAVLHAVVSPCMAPAVAARMGGRAAWRVHVTESTRDWAELLARTGAPAAAIA
jgi:hypothetical protein